MHDMKLEDHGWFLNIRSLKFHSSVSLVVLVMVKESSVAESTRTPGFVAPAAMHIHAIEYIKESMKMMEPKTRHKQALVLAMERG